LRHHASPLHSNYPSCALLVVGHGPPRADAQLAIPYLIVADESDLQAGKFLGLTWIFRANAAWRRLAGMPARPGIEQVHQIVRLNKPARHFLIGRVLDFALDP